MTTSKYSAFFFKYNCFPKETRGVLVMKKNLDKMGGVIYSESILLELVRSGIAREEAYKLVQRVAMKIWEKGGDFKELILNNREIMKYITPASIEKAFSINHHLKNVSYIFKRVFKS